MPPAPASMFLMKRSWPGTSTRRRELPRKCGPRGAEVDREATTLFLGEAIWVGAGEREDKRRLAVIDMTRSRDDPAFGQPE